MRLQVTRSEDVKAKEKLVTSKDADKDGMRVNESTGAVNSAGNAKKQAQKKGQNKDADSRKSNLITVSEFDDYDENAPSSTTHSPNVVSNAADSPPDGKQNKNEKP